jgi:hypothetical protein
MKLNLNNDYSQMMNIAAFHDPVVAREGDLPR